MIRKWDVAAPSRLGPGFRRLWGSSWATSLGDGLVLAAGPLLVASQTDSPFPVALAALATWLPPLLLGPAAGTLTGRVEARLLLAGAHAARCGVLGLLAIAVATGTVAVPLVLLALFCLGAAEVLADDVGATLMPTLVARDDLPVANARLQTGYVGLNQLAGPPLGGLLFAAGAAWPFVAHAVLMALGVVLLSRMTAPAPAYARGRETLDDVRAELVAGLRWVSRHRRVRALVLTVFASHVTFGAAWSVLVLYVTERLGLGAVGFGLATTVMALGGLCGLLGHRRLTAHVPLGDLLRVGLVVEALAHLALALTTTAYVAFAVLVVLGAHSFVWGTAARTLRQRAVPLGLRRRVDAVHSIGTVGGLVLGAVLGGLLAQQWGVVAPYWFAFAGSAVLATLLWQRPSPFQHADENPRSAAVRRVR